MASFNKVTYNFNFQGTVKPELKKTDEEATTEKKKVDFAVNPFALFKLPAVSDDTLGAKTPLVQTNPLNSAVSLKFQK